MEDNKPDIKLTLEQHRAILYKFLVLLVDTDKLDTKGFSAVINICKVVDALIIKSDKDGCLNELVVKCREDKIVKELIDIVDKEHEECRKRRQEQIKHKIELVAKVYNLFDDLYRY